MCTEPQLCVWYVRMVIYVHSTYVHSTYVQNYAHIPLHMDDTLLHTTLTICKHVLSS